MGRRWVCLILLIGSACAGEPRTGADAGSTYTVLGPPEWTARSSRNGGGKFLTFLELATPNERGELEGRLARSWEHSADYRDWTIHLRTDVRWHDGMPVTAADIAFTVDLWNHPDVLYPENPYESARIVDDSTVILRYKSGSMWHTYWYPGYWTVFYPKHLLEDLDPASFNEWEFWQRPVGNGPFRFVRYTPQTSVEFAANPDFYLGRPAIDRLVLRLGPESITELLAGNVDAMNLENRTAVEAIADDPRFVIYYEAWDDISTVLALQYDLTDPRLTDPRVRRAFAHAIDRRELNRLQRKWPKLPLVDVPFTESQYWSGTFPEPLTYDPAEAKRLLTEAGWRDEDGDGVRERRGIEMRIPMIVEGRYEPVAVYAQHQLGQVGVRLEITTLEFSTVMERARAGDFVLSMSYLWVSPDDPDAGLAVLIGPESPLHYDNPEAVALVEAALAARTPEALDSIYRELAPIIQTDQPFTFLTFGTEMYIAHRRVRGLSSPFRGNPIWAAGHLWLEESPN